MSRYRTKDGWIKVRCNPLILIGKWIGLPLLIIFMFISFAIGINVEIKKYFDYQEQRKIEQALKEREKRAKEQEKREAEIDRAIRESEKKEKEEMQKSFIGQMKRQKDFELWNYIKQELPKGTYVLNKNTMQKGKIIDYQGERIFTDMDWWFDYGIDDIEIIGYKEYKQYAKLMEKRK